MDRYIYYYGNDSTFYAEVESFFQQPALHKNKYFCQMIEQNIDTNHSLEKLINMMARAHLPHLIFIDFVLLEEKKELLEQLSNFFILAKSHHTLKSIPFIGLFKDSEQVERLSYFYSCGLTYSQIKSYNDKRILLDSFYLAFESRVHFPTYAVASNINLEYQPTIVSYLDAFNSEKVIIETDLNFREQEEVEVRFKDFSNLHNEKLTVTGISTQWKSRPYINNFELSINYPSPWDVIDENTPMKDTVDTWIANNFKIEQEYHAPILIIDSDLKHLSSILTFKNSFAGRLIYNSIMNEKVEEMLAKAKIDVVLFQMDDEGGIDISEITGEGNGQTNKSSNERNNLAMFTKLIRVIKDNENLAPVIIVFGTNSSSEAYREAYAYSKIITYHEDLSLEILAKLNTTYKSKGADDQNFFKFSHFDKRELVEIPFQVQINSLTEHEITFHSKKQLPYYCIIRLNDPFPCFATVVPETRELPTNPYGKHYMAFIHSLSEEKMRDLRRFINFILFEGITEFKIPENYNPKETIEQETEVQTTKTEDERKSSRPVAEKNDVERKLTSKKQSKL